MGKKQTKEHIEKGRLSKLGLKRSLETRRKLSIASKGRFKGLSYENRFGKEKAQILKQKLSDNAKINPNYGLKGKHHSEETRMKISLNHKGEKSNTWRGGISFKPYPTFWNTIYKQKILKRDNYTCQICNAKQIKSKFSVHHIDYNKKNCNPLNLITLCKSCHGLTNHNREKWINFFKGCC